MQNIELQSSNTFHHTTISTKLGNMFSAMGELLLFKMSVQSTSGDQPIEDFNEFACPRLCLHAEFAVLSICSIFVSPYNNIKYESSD